MNILIIDDDPHWRELLSRYLSQANYGVLTAHSGNEGMRVVAEARPELVICDVFMPDGDGYEFVDALRQDKELRDTPVLACTGLGRLESELMAKEQGFDGLLIKNADPEMIVESIKVFLSGRR